MILLIDNYDSFTYNLYQYFQILNVKIDIRRNDRIDSEYIKHMNPEAIVISPGPCTPDKAGNCLDIVAEFKESMPFLGICLGHQIIGQAFGAKVVKAGEPVHGKVHPVTHSGQGVFSGLKNPLDVTRYHSLIIKEDSIPESFDITAWTLSGEVMGIRHRDYLIEGIQFHPEAVLTENGLEMLNNFISEVRSDKRR